MKTIRSTILLLFVAMSASLAKADTNTASCFITSLVQTTTDSTASVFTDLSGSNLINICGTSPTGQFYIQTTNGTKPSYASMVPYFMAALLYNKPVVIALSGCTGWGIPIVTGVYLQQ